MAFLRLGSTRRVVALLAGVAALLVLVAVAAGAALGGGGEPPPAKPLAQAIHDSLTGPKVEGVTARVNLTSHLFDGATTDTSSALLKGGSGRLWAAPGKLRIELQSDNGDAQIVFADGKGFVYDGPSNNAYTFAVGGHDKSRQKTANDAVPTIAQIQKRIAHAEQNASIGDAQPDVLGGQPAYRVRVTPHDQGGLVGAAGLAWDAARGVPLDVAIYARGASSPAVELTVSDIGYGAVDPAVFDLTPPADAHVVDLGGGNGGGADQSGADNSKPGPAPGFSAVAPATLGSRSHRQTKPAGDGYVVLYGKGLGTIAVVEHKVKPGEKPAAPSSSAQDDRGQALQLPTVSINGTQATAFGTPLGGVVMFQRDGVSYTVAGSQPLAVLEAAARAL